METSTKPPSDHVTISISPRLASRKIEHTGTAVYDWEDGVHERINDEGQQRVSHVDEKLLPALPHETLYQR